MSQISFNLIVLRVATIEQSLAFYRALGLLFEQHQHGSGAVHYASTLGSVTLELYPRRNEADTTRAVRIGFAVADLDTTIARLEQQGVRIITAPHNSMWGRRAVVADPDDHRIELVQQSQDIEQD